MSEKTFEQILAEAIGTEIRAAYKAIQSENKIHDGVADIYSLIPGSVPNEYGYLNYIGKNTGPLTFDYSGLAFSLYPSQTFRLPFRGGNLRVTGGTLNPQQVFLANTPTFNSQQDIASLFFPSLIPVSLSGSLTLPQSLSVHNTIVVEPANESRLARYWMSNPKRIACKSLMAYSNSHKQPLPFLLCLLWMRSRGCRWFGKRL